MAHQILAAHNQSEDGRHLKIRFDSLASHDITYVGIILTARASGMKEFPVPFVLTNCHNTLCAVGGTINEDDHVFRPFGGQEIRRDLCAGPSGGDSPVCAGNDDPVRRDDPGFGQPYPLWRTGHDGHRRGGPELVKQLLERTYELTSPEVVAVYLDGRPAPGVGPQDVALALIRAVFQSGFVKNKVLEFIGPGVAGLPIDFRNGIDVMTTETSCLSTIWQTDEQVEAWYRIHGRPEDYRLLEPGDVCWYDGIVRVDLSRMEPMIALPFHPSNAWPIAELNRNAPEILREVEAEGQKQIENPHLDIPAGRQTRRRKAQGGPGVRRRVRGGHLRQYRRDGGNHGPGVHRQRRIQSERLSGEPAGLSGADPEPIHRKTDECRRGHPDRLLRSLLRGRRHPGQQRPQHPASTRNFPNREGSKPANGQLASVALMDARSIAATALNGGLLTPATEWTSPQPQTEYVFDQRVYDKRVYRGFGKPHRDEPLQFGPNIVDWPKMGPLPENLLLKVASVIHDPVTTTDELIPSGDTSSYRSNPLKLAEFTLSRKDPGYVARAKAFQELECRRLLLLTEGGPTDSSAGGPFFILDGGKPTPEEISQLLRDTGLATVIFAVKPGDGSAREQAASCQKVLGGQANIALEYATKRYRSNLINWGMLPFTVQKESAGDIAVDDLIYIPGIRPAILSGAEKLPAFVIRKGGRKPLELKLEGLSREDREIILAGSLINYYAEQRK